MWIKSTKMKVNNYQIFHHCSAVMYNFWIILFNSIKVKNRAKIVYEGKNKSPISFILDHFKHSMLGL